MEPKNDLVKALEKEREKIHRYETKLKDLVSAYKNQMKENETLKATIKSLRSSRKPQHSDQESAQGSDADGSAPEENYQEELEKLTASMTEMMEEKKKIQEAAIAERKALKQEYEEKIKSLEIKMEEMMDQSSQSNQQITELKKKLRTEQMDREKEQADHASILRELNKSIHEHMIDKEDLQHQVSELQKELSISSQKPTQSENYEVIIADLTNQLQDMRVRVKDSENRANQQRMLGELQEEIGDIKRQHSENIIKEQLRGDEAERKLGEIASKSESRISELESKVSQLSEMVGNYEKTRFIDQQAIQKLKHRVTQLDIENTALAKVAHPEADDNNMSVDEIVDRLKQLKSSLRRSCDNSTEGEYQVKLGEVFLDETQLHRKCDEEYRQLKDEFEKYKLRAQSVLKNKHNKDQGSSKEIEDMKNTIIELKDRSRQLSNKHNTETQLLQDTISELRQSIANQHTLHKQELSSHTADCEQKVLDAEQRLHQHRDRTINLLAEKDEEIELLKRKLGTSNYITPDEDVMRSAASSQGTDRSSPVDQLFSAEGPTSSQLIHYHQELARSSQDITTLRKQKHDLESSLHELQSSITTKQEQYEEQIAFLKEEIHRLDRNKSREGVNLEYLKNIVYKYMVASDPISRQSIFNAISTILHFSPQERKAVTGKSS